MSGPSQMTSQPVQTLLSTLQRAGEFEACSADSLHPFSTSAPSTIAALNDLIQATDQISSALAAYTSLPFSEPKLISLLRQHTTIYHAVHHAEQSTSALISALRPRAGINYGENVPNSPQDLEDFCISRLQEWGTSVGMQMITDRNGGRTIVTLAGNILVIDTELTMGATRLEMTTLKISYAAPNPPNGMLTTEGSPALNACLKRCIDAYIEEVQGRKDPIEAQRKGRVVIEQLAYLMMLDKLALEEGAAGVRWLKELDRTVAVAEEVAKGELEGVASSLIMARAPLDIYLLRSHAFPLPCISSPCLSFLVYISPKAYLTLLRSVPDALKSDFGNFDIDIPVSHLSIYLSNMPVEGTSLATLRLVPYPPGVSSSTSVEPQSQSPRPMFPLIPISAPSSEHPLLRNDKHDWILDFTQNGRKGVVMSQSRMRVIESIVGGQIPDVDMTEISSAFSEMMFSGESWVDVLLNAKDRSRDAPGRYVAIYRSPSSAHPPLRLRLTAPAEPGFRIEQVHVRSMREVWGILEVVREQCWLNGMLQSITWTVESLDGTAHTVMRQDADDGATTEAELEAILNGTFRPLELPINVYLPTSYANTSSSPTPMIYMASPEHPPGEGQVEIDVHWDDSKERGVTVAVRSRGWGLGFDIETDKLEEVCRRGGIWGLPGRIWSQGGANGS